MYLYNCDVVNINNCWFIGIESRAIQIKNSNFVNITNCIFYGETNASCISIEGSNDDKYNNTTVAKTGRKINITNCEFEGFGKASESLSHLQKRKSTVHQLQRGQPQDLHALCIFLGYERITAAGGQNSNLVSAARQLSGKIGNVVLHPTRVRQILRRYNTYFFRLQEVS